ncbi:MAG: sulfur carrier protein ThiS [Candidatus Binatia bacterium]|nr:sulfur carrier protein ThiS [Candidatus Binatia bacterium]
MRSIVSSVRVRLNGEWHSLRDGLTVAELVAELDLHNQRIAIEVNRAIVPRHEYANVRLRENDEIEVVHFVGGG